MTPREEWAQDALNDRDDQAAWEAARNDDLGLERGWVSFDEMVARHAAERAAVESQELDGYEWRAASLPAEMACLSLRPVGECPAGGSHAWVELTAYEAGPGWDTGGWRCDECGAVPPVRDPDDYPGPS